MPEQDAKSGCGCSSGGGCCRGIGKTLVKSLIPLLVGGIIGYLIGGQCAVKKAMCPISGASAPAATTPPAAQR